MHQLWESTTSLCERAIRSSPLLGLPRRPALSHCQPTRPHVALRCLGASAKLPKSLRVAQYRGPPNTPLRLPESPRQTVYHGGPRIASRAESTTAFAWLKFIAIDLHPPGAALRLAMANFNLKDGDVAEGKSDAA